MKNLFWTRPAFENRRPRCALRTRSVQRTATHPLAAQVLEERVLLSSQVTTGQFAYPMADPIVDTATGLPFGSAGPSGYTPAQIRHAYGFDNITFGNGTIPGDGTGTTIAIVDAYDDPNIASDLQQFSLAFGLPQANFTKVNQSGGTTYPPPNANWITEIALDVQWAHAVAPGANILLVEANSNSFSDLFTAVNYAKSVPGVVAVSMSWGGSEFSFESLYDSTFTTPAGHAGVTFVASSGDSGAPTSYPSASPNVLSVGGTTLTLNSGNWGAESGWNGSGGGISAYETQPSYQNGIVTQSTTKRTNPDVAYDSNPNTGFPVYDSYNNGSATPWGQWGGTSAAAPQWAALMAIVAQGRALQGQSSLDGPTQTLPLLYSLPSAAFHDITTGASGGSPNYSAGAGYDLVTGRGSPIANLVVSGLVNNGVVGIPTLTVSSIGAVSPNPRNATVASIDFAFSSAINPGSLTVSDLSLTRDGGTNLLTSGQTVSLVAGNTYRLSNLGSITGASGSYTLTVSAAGVLDASGVAGIGSASTSWVMDTTAPTAALQAVSPNPRNTAIGTLDVTFSEAIDASTLAIGDFTLTRSGGANLLTSAQTITFVSGTTYRIGNLTGLTGSDGNYVLTVTAGSVRDLAGNATVAVPSTSWTTDTVAPVATLQPVFPNPRNTAVSTIDITFSEAIDATTLVLGDLALTQNGIAIPLTSAQTIAFVSGTTYRIGNLAALTGNDGAYALTLTAGSVRDPAGNANVAAASTSWMMDTAAPTVALQTVSPNPRHSPVDTLDLTFSEAIDASTLVIGDLTLTQNGVAIPLTLAQTITFVSGTTYRVGNLTGLTGSDGNYVLTVTAGSVRDLAGNASVAAASTSWTTDTVAPVVILQTVSPNPRNTTVGTIDVTLSKPIDASTLTLGDFSLTRDGSLNLLTSAQTITFVSGTTWRIGNLAGLTGSDGNYVLTVSAGSVQDLAGNTNAAAVSTTWTSDTVPPAVVMQTVSPNPRNTAVGTIDVTFSEPIDASTFTPTDLSLTRDGGPNLLTPAQTITFVSGTTYRIGNLTGLTGASGAYVLTLGAAALTDLAGNANSAGASTAWTTDSTGPTVSVSAVAPNPRNTSVAQLDFTFSEAISSSTLALADLTLTRNGGANLLTSAQTITWVSGNTYRVNNLAAVTGVDGAYLLTVSANGVQDLVGNAGTGTGTAGWTRDTVAPTVTSAAVTPSTRNTPVDTLDVTFSEAIDPSTLSWQDLTLTRDGGPNLITSAQTLSWISGTTWRIGGLTALTSIDGSYSLKIAATGVKDLAGNTGKGTKSVAWKLDTLPPSSQVTALSAEQSSLSFTVAVTGTDPTPPTGSAPAGILRFNVYVSTNGGDFVLWKALAPNSPSAVFKAQSSTTYRFRSVAVDKAGNVESKAADAVDASTFVPDLTPPVSSVYQVVMSTPTFSVKVRGSDVGGTLAWFNVYVSIDGGAAQLIAHLPGGTPNGSGLYYATADFNSLSGTHTYAFYSVATDDSGNVEAGPAAADKAVTYTLPGSSPHAQQSLVGFGLTNPALVGLGTLDAVFSDPDDLVGALVG